MNNKSKTSTVDVGPSAGRQYARAMPTLRANARTHALNALMLALPHPLMTPGRMVATACGCGPVEMPGYGKWMPLPPLHRTHVFADGLRRNIDALLLHVLHDLLKRNAVFVLDLAGWCEGAQGEGGVWILATKSGAPRAAWCS